MPTQAKSRVRPLDAAVRRIVELAGRAATPARMSREVEIIIAEWRQAVDDELVAERIAGLLEQLDAGIIDAEEQVNDVDRDQPAALTQAKATLAALVACRNAARAALPASV